MAKKDPFRTAERWTICPQCGDIFGWNPEDGLTGQTCGCGYAFKGREQRWYGPLSVGKNAQIKANLTRIGRYMSKRNPVTDSGRQTICPRCAQMLFWDTKEGLTGQICGKCGYVFRGREKAWKGSHMMKQGAAK